ncbi:MAG: hypothetical protein HY902_04485, partial [Deltaproteobacteria bacterium]|nr:hypothetical protein [Deltaproteobacteria bacterium]
MIRKLLMLSALACLALPSAAHAKTVVCPGPDTLPGIDVSYWQGTIDWAKVKASGKKYVIMRAAHALSVDTKFDFNWSQCHAQGLHCGVYQFFEPDIDPIKQADLMLSKMGKLKPGDLPPVIDVESVGSPKVSQAALAAAVGKWITHVKAATGRTPIIYTGAYFWEDNVNSSAYVSNPLWHAQYCSNCCPNIANPWKKWYFWQYSSKGSVSGISGNVDLDIWNGNAAALDTFSGDTAPPACTPACSGTVMTKADCSKSDCATSESTCVNDSLGLRCVSKYCPATGSSTVCLPGNNNAILGTCKDGKLSKGDCSAYGAFCSTAAGAQAKCVSAFCAKDSASKPVPGDVCLPDGKRYTCAANGDIAANPCPADSTCQMPAGGGAAICKPKGCVPTCDGSKIVGSDCGSMDCAVKPGGMCVLGAQGPHCVDKVCPTTGANTVCLADGGAMAIGVCNEGQLVKATCKKGEEVCVEVPGSGGSGGAMCAPSLCVPNPPNLPPAHDLCNGDGAIVHCSAQGVATTEDCPPGHTCDGSTIPPSCKPLPQPAEDAGSGTDSDASGT